MARSSRDTSGGKSVSTNLSPRTGKTTSTLAVDSWRRGGGGRAIAVRVWLVGGGGSNGGGGGWSEEQTFTVVSTLTYGLIVAAGAGGLSQFGVFLTGISGGGQGEGASTPVQTGAGYGGGYAGGGGGGGVGGSNGGTGYTYPDHPTTGWPVRMPGAGGNGIYTDITGSNVYYAGGGAGSSNWYTIGAPAGTRGGGGGGSSHYNAGNGEANTGGGGGQAYCCAAGAGGSGIVIIRYLTAEGNPTIGAGLTAPTYATLGSDTIATFTGGSGQIGWE